MTIRAPRIELIVRVDDDSFESKLEMPIDASPEKIDAIVASWLGALREAVKLGQPKGASE